MAIGPHWSKGNREEFVELENYFNQARANAGALARFAANLRSPSINANIMCERARLFAPYIEAGDRPRVRTLFSAIADNWYSDAGQPMWYRDTTSRPAEMHRVTCASEAYLADLLGAGAAGCEFFGQCEHPEFETWITWPRHGFVGEYLRVSVFASNNYLYDRAMYPPAVTLTMANRIALQGLPADVLQYLQAVKADDVVRKVQAADGTLRQKIHDRRQGLNLPVRAGDEQALDDAVRDAERTLIGELAQHPDPVFPAYKGTALAIGDDRGQPLIGDVEVKSLDDFLMDPREPGLNQPPSAMFAPAGAPACGVRFRWNRSLASPWPPYRPTVNCPGGLLP